MADEPKARSQHQQRADKAQRTTDEAKAAVDAEVKARNAKTARLKEQRLAKEAEEAALKAAKPEKPKKSPKARGPSKRTGA